MLLFWWAIIGNRQVVRPLSGPTDFNIGMIYRLICPRHKLRVMVRYSNHEALDRWQVVKN
ncbi:MAG: hypothetical protein ACE1ZE_05870 [Candidatus Binatia bacterium]